MADVILHCMCRFRAARLIWAAILLALSVLRSGAATAPDYSGHYELVGKDASRHFSLDVHQQKHHADISFAAASPEGAAPDGAGKGSIKGGVLSFKFKDSFNNEGTCTLQPLGSSYHLNMVVTKIVQTQPLHFYGDVVLRRVSH